MVISDSRPNQIEISVDDILLDVLNPRNEVSEDQKEALSRMITGNEDKIFNLAKDIQVNGQNPIDLIAVIWDEDTSKYIALDGNRRITAIKITRDSSLITEFPKLKNRIDKLDVSKMPDLVNASLFESREDAYGWIKLRHTGENDGVGTVSWDAQQQARFDNSKYTVSLKFFEYLDSKKIGTDELRSAAAERITNVERLLSDPHIRQMLGIYKIKGSISFPAYSEKMERQLNKFLNAITSESFSVNDIRTKDDRLHFAEQFEDDKLPIQTTEFISLPPKKNSSDQQIVVSKKKKRRSSPTTNDRKTLIPSSLNVNIPNAKLYDLFSELKRVDVSSYCNVVGCAYRVLVEITMDCFKESYPTVLKYDINSKLTNKIENVRDYITSLPEYCKDPAKKEINQTMSALSKTVEQLNGYVHSSVIQPDAQALKVSWNHFAKDFEIIMELINASGQTKGEQVE